MSRWVNHRSKLQHVKHLPSKLLHNYLHLCIADWFENMVIYSTATKIKMIHIKNNHVEIIQNDVNCTVLTVAKNYLYYATNRGNKERILKTSIINKKIEMIIELGRYTCPFILPK